jgi:hypothetical protein
MVTSPARSQFFAAIGLSTIIAAGVLTVPAPVVAQDRDGQALSLSANRPRIWEDRGPIGQLDLFWGSGGPDRVPVGPFTFVAEDMGGTNPKAHVRDVNGVLWGIKWDEEAQAEIAASRLAWAMGLRVDETYYVESGRIVFPEGRRPTFQRIGPFIDRAGNLTPARFKRWVPEQKIKGDWAFNENPLRDEGGYSVLVLMNVIMANWDAKDANNKLLSVPDETGVTDWYLVGDYGACFGKLGGRGSSHSKYRLKDYVGNPSVISSMSGTMVHMNYKGRNAAAHAAVTLEGARFFAARAADLSLAQVKDAFRAAHATGEDLHGFAEAVYARIREVVTKVQ